jgi:arsenate reductase
MKYFHNPRCSKSRQCLTYMLDNVDIVLYLNEELHPSVYLSLLQRYDGDVSDLLRLQESPAKGIDLLSYSIDDLADFLSRNPIVLQRPIYDDGVTIFIGRPIENISKIFKTSSRCWFGGAWPGFVFQLTEDESLTNLNTFKLMNTCKPAWVL